MLLIAGHGINPTVEDASTFLINGRMVALQGARTA
jgi:uncharacterized Zn-binding protein involved in type VI secretion